MPAALSTPPNHHTTKYRQRQLISQYLRITRLAMVSARMAQSIHLLVLDLRIPLLNAGHESKNFCFVVCDINSEKEQLKVKLAV